MNPKQIKNAIIVTVAILAAGLFYQLIVVPTLQEEANFDVCGEKHYLRKCYNIKRQECVSVWNGTKALCYRRHLEEARKDRPALLEGPVTQQCREYEFNKIFKFMTSSSSDESCEGLKERIEDYVVPSSVSN